MTTFLSSEELSCIQAELEETPDCVSEITLSLEQARLLVKEALVHRNEYRGTKKSTGAQQIDLFDTKAYY